MSESPDPTSRDQLIFDAIDKLLALPSPDYEQILFLIRKAGDVQGIGLWFSNWERIEANPDQRAAFIATLEAAHRSRQYQSVIELCGSHFLPRISLPHPDIVQVTCSNVEIPDLTSSGPDDVGKEFNAVITETLSSIQENLGMVVTGERTLRVWEPKLEGEHQQFLRDLKIPIDSRLKPDMLLHRLGELQNGEPFKARLEKLFQPGYLAHKFLVNSSGSGKTRLALEGLCHHWGIYLTAMKDTGDHGSRDLQQIIDVTIPHSPSFRSRLSESGENFSKDLECNRKIAESHFNYLLFARLRIFRMFLEIVASIPYRAQHRIEEYRKRWLHLQIRPSILGCSLDIFHQLTSTLLVKFFGRLSEGDLVYYVEQELDLVQQLCLRITQTIGPQTIFLVIDEVQHAAASHFDAFRSGSPIDPPSQIFPRPVFREMLHAWMPLDGLVVVAAGTGVDAVVLEETMRSAVAKYFKYDSLHDTGAFSDEELVLQYMAQFIPAKLLFLQQYLALVVRVSYWLQGRFRFTAGYISELLAAEFQHPHELLNEYIYRLTAPPKRQILTNVEAITPRVEGFIATDGTQFVDPNSNMLSTISQIVSRYWIRSNLGNHNVSDSEGRFVEWGFARFCSDPSDPTSRDTLMDEPIAMLALGQWLNAGFGETVYHKFALDIGLHHATGENSLENFIALCFTKIFNWGTGHLKDIFSFPKGDPTWADQTATLISLYKVDGELVEEAFVGSASRPSHSIGTHARNFEGVLRWLKHEERAPICFPPQKMGPDLLFILRLQDGRRIWVAVQVKFDNTPLLKETALLGALRSVTPAAFFGDEGKGEEIWEHLVKLPNRVVQEQYEEGGHIRDAGECSLLRVIVSFPGETLISRSEVLEKSEFYNDEHPLAALNMNYVATMTRNMEPRDFLTTVKNSMVDTDVTFIPDNESECVREAKHWKDLPPYGKRGRANEDYARDNIRPSSGKRAKISEPASALPTSTGMVVDSPADSDIYMVE
ncbi:hypothetical protein C8R46DRAFT_879948 [Mycena filopes]|nr:hypothetical protein C8R46DRAFT_879948 [Mycena filopes]